MMASLAGSPTTHSCTKSTSAANDVTCAPTTAQLLAFLAASVVFIALPGPSVLFAIGRALTVGRRDALLSVTGNALGLLVQVACVAIGLGALVEASATAYTVLKLVGAAYVIFLGIQAIRHRADARLALTASETARPANPWRAVWAGFVVGGTNPKTIVFFAAFLPQFMNAAAPATPQLLFLGLLFGMLALAQDSILALLAGQARTWFSRSPKRLDHLSVTGGVAMVALAPASRSRAAPRSEADVEGGDRPPRQRLVVRRRSPGSPLLNRSGAT